MKINLNRVLDYLEEHESCKVISIDNFLSIIDLENKQLALYNKDYRLLNDLAKDYVQRKYPLFRKEFSDDLGGIIVNIFKIPINYKKLKNLKSFKKIVKKTVISSVNERGQVTVRRIIRKRKNIS